MPGSKSGGADELPLHTLSKRPAHARQDTDNSVLGSRKSSASARDAGGASTALPAHLAHGGEGQDDNDAPTRAEQAALETNTTPAGRLLSRTSIRPSAAGVNASDADSKALATALLSTAASSEINDPKFDLSKRELWAYYIYYIGNSGLGTYNFGPSQWQNLLTQQSNLLAPLDAAGNPTCGGSGQPACYLMWAGQMRTPTSIVLLANGISFVLQAFLFVCLGSLMDFGTFRPWVLIGTTVIGIAVSFAWLGVTTPEQWDPAGTTLYMLGLLSYQLSLSFWAAAFPGMARCSREVRDEEARLRAGESSAEKLEETDSLMRNRLSNVGFAVSSLGELVLLAVIQGMLVGIHADRDTESNTRALSAVIAFSGGAWVITALPWFFLEKHRPGQPLPPGRNYVTAGLAQLWATLKIVYKLKQSLLYLCIYFILGDSLVTATTVISTITNDLVTFSTTQLNLILLVGIAAQGIGIYAFWLVQKRLKLSTLVLFKAIVPGIVLLELWGLIGIWTPHFGFKNVWEAYAYQVVYGIFVCPWYAVSLTMISCVAPQGYEFLFFSLYSFVGRTSAFVGPFVTSAIANDTNNQNMPFTFLLGLTAVSCVGIYFLDLRKARLEQQVFLREANAIKGVDASKTAILPDDARSMQTQTTATTAAAAPPSDDGSDAAVDAELK